MNEGLLSLFFLFLSLASAAQGERTTPGKLLIKQKNLNENLDHIPAPQLAELKASQQKITAIANEADLIKKPVGYTLQIDFDFHKPPVLEIPSQRALTSTVFYDFAEFYTDKKSGAIKQEGEFSGGLRITVNDLLFPSYPGPNNDIADANYPIPIFFYGQYWPRQDSTSDYIEMSLHSNLPYRVITNGKALFVPLSKQQYLTFQIALEGHIAKKWQSQLDDQTEGLSASQKNFEHSVSQGLMRKGEYDTLMKTLQESIDTWKKGAADSKQKLVAYQKQLAALTPSQRSSPAFIDFGKQEGDQLNLVENDDPNKVGLFTPNPAYFNPALPATAVQLITVRLSYHPTMTSPFMKEKINAAFQQIDYAKLKTLIQK